MTVTLCNYLSFSRTVNHRVTGSSPVIGAEEKHGVRARVLAPIFIWGHVCATAANRRKGLCMSFFRHRCIWLAASVLTLLFTMNCSPTNNRRHVSQCLLRIFWGAACTCRASWRREGSTGEGQVEWRRIAV